MQHVAADPEAKAELQQYAAQLAAEAPQEDAQLLAWYPVAKGKLLQQCMSLSKQVRQRQAASQMQPRQAATAALVAAYEAVEGSAAGQPTEVALLQVVHARQQWRDTVTHQAQLDEWRRRKEWVHPGERPNPVLTGMLNPKQAATYTPPMLSPVTGMLVEGGRAQAQLVAEHWARVSDAPVQDGVAMAEVLDIARANGVQLSGEEAERVGAQVVTEAEVRSAIKHSKPGKSPGMDGLPVEVYRLCADSWAPLLARVFTAMGTLRQLPAGLLDGVIVAIFKKGQRTNPADYRPITLLNTDYRVLAKVLAFRLKSVQGKLIGREQTAFLPGRHIGENVMMLQLLPHALAPSSEAVVVIIIIIIIFT
jgi:hypothetical protein